jgi:HEAT repeat protein
LFFVLKTFGPCPFPFSLLPFPFPVPIKASASAEIRQLIAALGGGDDVQREAAIARLAVIGARAVDALVTAYSSTTDTDLRIAILRALESSGDPRTIAVAREAIADRGDVAVAAATALRGLLDSTHGPSATEALDLLVATVLDPSADRALRMAAFDALHAMPEGVRARIAEALKTDPDPQMKARTLDSSRGAAAADVVWQEALEGRLPAKAGSLREAAQTRASVAAFTALQKMIDAVRTREGSVAAGRKTEWQVVRGALHQALALRGSRVAVYDLRESVQDARGPLPSTFLAALHVVGDQTCLEPLAAAYVRAQTDQRWQSQLAAAFHAIARRERITKRHAIVKRIAARWPEAAESLMARA